MTIWKCDIGLSSCWIYYVILVTHIGYFNYHFLLVLSRAVLVSFTYSLLIHNSPTSLLTDRVLVRLLNVHIANLAISCWSKIFSFLHLSQVVYKKRKLFVIWKQHFKVTNITNFLQTTLIDWIEYFAYTYYPLHQITLIIDIIDI